jgi:hypothetical protein
MKNIVLGTLIAAAASQAAGCVISSDDSATVRATWAVVSLPGNTEVGCPPGTTTASLYSQESDADGTVIPGGEMYIDKFNCEDGAGTSAPMVPSIYRSWVQLEDDSGASVYAKTIEVLLDVRSQDKQLDTQILANGGYFELSWDLVGKVSGNPLSCGQAGADGVENLATDVNSPSNAKSDIFNCADGFGITAGIPEGTYTISVSALQGQAAVGVAPALTNKRILSPNKVTDLGTVQIPIDGQ